MGDEFTVESYNDADFPKEIAASTLQLLAAKEARTGKAGKGSSSSGSGGSGGGSSGGGGGGGGGDGSGAGGGCAAAASSATIERLEARIKVLEAEQRKMTTALRAAVSEFK